VHDSIVHFWHLLEGGSFVIFTDHLPLVGVLHRVSEPKLDCHRRQLSVIADFTAEICYIAGQSNVVADTLSQPAVASTTHAEVAIRKAASPPSSPQAGLAVLAAVAGLHFQPGGPLAAQTIKVRAAGLQLPSSLVGQLNDGQAVPSAAQQGGSATGRPLLEVVDTAEAQLACPDCRRAVHVLSLKDMPVMLDGRQLLVDTSSGVMRPVVQLQSAAACLRRCTIWPILA
jgi:hypothetical protein